MGRSEKKYNLREIDLAAVNKHHVPGTAYHWKHGYIPLDARTAALWKKKDFEHKLIREGRIHTPEPEEWHSAFTRGKAVESPTASKSNRATRELPFAGVAKSAPKESGPTEFQREASRRYLDMHKTYLDYSTGRGSRNPSETFKAEQARLRSELSDAAKMLHASGLGGKHGLPTSEEALHEPKFQPYEHGVDVASMLAENKKWHDFHGKHFRGAKEVAGPEYRPKRLVSSFKRGDKVNDTTLPGDDHGKVVDIHPTGGVTVRWNEGKLNEAEHYYTHDIAENAFEKVAPTRKPRTVKPKTEKPTSESTRSTIEKLENPKKGDILEDSRGRYRFSGSTWMREYQNSDGTWRRSSYRGGDYGPTTMIMQARRRGIDGVEAEDINSHFNSAEFQNRADERIRQAGIKQFGSEKMHGFIPVGATEAMSAHFDSSGSPMDPEMLKLITSTYSTGHHVFLKHDNGTVLHIGTPGTSKKDVQTLAQRVHEVTAATEHMIGPQNGGRVMYHLDPTYADGKRWGSTLAYVLGGDTLNVHISPKALKYAGEKIGGQTHHWLHSHNDAANTLEHTLIHELGHIHHNRTGNFDVTTRGEHAKFHASVYSGVPGAQYGKKNNREGYAEAFAQHITNDVHGERIHKKLHIAPEDEASMSMREAHDALARKYAEHFGWTTRAAKGITA